MLSTGSIIILKNLGAFKVTEVHEFSATLSFLGDKNVSALRKEQPNTKILHWINQTQSKPYSIVLYDRLLTPTGAPNPRSKQTHKTALIPASLLADRPEYVQFERLGFFKFNPSAEELLLCTRL
jgi:hypothetical protein